MARRDRRPGGHPGVAVILASVFGWLATGPSWSAEAPAILQVSTPHGTSVQTLPGGTGVVAARAPTSDGVTQARIQAAAADGGRQRVIVELRGAPLARAGSARSASLQRTARAGLDAEHRRVTDEIARLEAGTGRSAPAGAVGRQFFGVFNGVAATLSAGTIAALRAHPDVAAVHPDREMRAILDTSVPYVRATNFWASHGGFRGAGQVIAVVDTGVDYTHADLGACGAVGGACKVAGGYDFHNDDADPLDDHGHGTHVAATAAGNGALLGVAPDATVLAYKVLGADGSGLTSNVIAGIEAAVDPDGDLETDDHADVINLSLGGVGGPDDPASQAVDAATAAGVVVVAAAGNDGAYYAVGSPGAARTAVTVASIGEEDGYPAWTNSAGPVPGTLDLKPEIGAPGVFICAARAEGTALGADCLDATHIAISGTSMATPHVAGAAALLHGALPALSPEDVKSLLVQNGAPVTFDFLQGGATLLDVSKSAAAHTVVSPQTLSFGRVVAAPIWEASRTLSVRNIGTKSRSYVLTATGHYWGLPAGATIAFTPRSFSLAPGASRTVDVRLTVDNAAVPTPGTTPWAYDASISLASSGEKQVIPAIFVKAAVLRIHTDPVADLVYLHDRGNLQSAQVVTPTGTTTELLVGAGTYDVIAMFPGTPPPMVVRENVAVADERDETIRAADAVHTVTLRGRNEVGAPLAHTMRVLSLYHRTSGLGLSFFTSDTTQPFAVPLSEISGAYDLDFGALAQGPGKTYLVTEALAGVSADGILENTPGELTRGALRYFTDPGETTTGATEFLSVMLGSSIGVGLGGPPVSPADRDLWFTPSRREDNGVFLQPWVGLGGGTPHSHNCPWYQGSTTPGVIEACNPMDRFHPAYETSTGELPLDLGPASFFLELESYGSVAILRPVVAAWTWAFHSPGGDGPEAPTGTVGYRLLSGSTVRASGVLAQSGFGGPSPPYFDLATAGPYVLETDPLEYWIGGLRATARVALAFDTRLGDAAPPWLRRVEVRSDGALAEVVPTGGHATLDVEVHDDAGAGLALTLARIDGGTLVPVALADLGGGVFRAVMPDACDRAGPFNALITATDAAGNTLREWLTPAFVCRPATCGNGIVESGEVCDDGNLLPGDACNAACSATAACGDGVLDPGEACDDGNLVAGDCCSTTCQPETAGAACDDGMFCNGADRCDAAGSCARHDGSPCSSRPQCNTACDETSDACAPTPAGAPCGTDANPCTDDVCDGAGACTHPANAAPCDDGVYCNGPDTCSGGVCDVHAGDPCPGAGDDECVGACNEAARSCFAPWGTPCTDDGSVCTWDSCNAAGACAHVPSNPGVICRDATDPCDVPEVCNGFEPTCPADAGIADTDGDALCDGLDPCTNVGHARDFTTPPVTKLVLGRTFVEPIPGNDSFVLRGALALPPSVAFWQLFPQRAEARLVLRTAAGMVVADVGLPGEWYGTVTARGWLQTRNGRQWAWRDRTRTPLGGIRDLTLRLLGASDQAGASVRLAVTATAGHFPLGEADVPVNVSLTLGDVAAAAAGRCVESAFVATDCTMGSGGTKVTCKR